ncbi:thermopsin precursor [mine drainage metagenome]|uniref:Thermopsin n=1 Tax=mine drainage metagenome TaxID=410659 RepID=T0YJC7_9ZZZZ
MTYSGWVVYPFYGLYPADTVYAYNFPVSPILVHLPHTFVVSSNLTLTPTPTVDFSVNAHTVSLPVPGAAYIIGDLWYNYSWEGVTYSNGPYPDNPSPGGLSPQFGVVGGPSGGIGNFLPPTQGSLVPRIRPFGQTGFVQAASKAFRENVDQTGEVASNLTWQPAAGNNWTVGYQNGGADQGVLSYTPSAHFNVTFQETGLPSGTRWYVNVSGVGSFNTTGSSLSFYLYNGTYSYTISSGGRYYAPTPGTGSLDVKGAALTVSVAFRPYSSRVTFTETGLPTGQPWEVTLGPQTLSATGSAIHFTVLNGSYSFTVDPSKGWLPSPPSGIVLVAGVATGVSITFSPPSFPVTFLRIAGTPPSWSITFSNGAQPSTTSASLVTHLPNATYAYAVGTPDTLWKPTPAFGSLTVAGGPITVNVTFVAATYTVDVVASGIPGSVAWWANISGQTPTEVQGTQSTFLLTNGSYLIQLASTDPLYRPTPRAVGFTVQGSALSVNVTFQRVSYLVSILASSGPGPASWNLTVAGVGSWSTPASGVFLDLSNGSYPYAVSSGDPTWRPVNASGTIVVDGTGSNWTVAFTRVVYPVVFQGVAGTGPGSWGIGINGGPTHPESNQGVEVSLPNGTYVYQVLSGNVSWRGTPSTANLTVLGHAVTVPLHFSLVRFDLVFQVINLPGGDAWQVNLTAVTTLTGTSGSLNVSLANGSYGFRVLPPSGMTASPAFGNVTVQGQPVTETITLAAESSSSHSPGLTFPFSFSGEGLYLGLSIVVAGVAAILIAALASRRRRQPPPPDRS